MIHGYYCSPSIDPFPISHFLVPTTRNLIVLLPLNFFSQQGDFWGGHNAKWSSESVAKAGLDGGAGDGNVDSTASPKGQPQILFYVLHLR